MHTKKRHQNMFQDLNRKLHHAEKDRESPASDSKVTHYISILLIIHFHRFSRKCRTKQILKKKKSNGKHNGGNSNVTKRFFDVKMTL